MPRVSIVIPVYNGANYLAEAIDSALAQEEVAPASTLAVEAASRRLTVAQPNAPSRIARIAGQASDRS